MIKIISHNNSTQEVEYIVSILLTEFMGVEYVLTHELSDSKYYSLILPNNNELIIEDHFFSDFNNDLDYLNINNIPIDVKYSDKNSIHYIVEKDIPIIFGRDYCSTNLNYKNKLIRCGIDVFASCFFMLTRWEEYVNKKRDVHKRFSAKDSLAYKSNFLDRPVVNEYLEMLKNMLLELGYNNTFKPQQFKFILTHDVDIPVKYPNIPARVKDIARDVLQTNNIFNGFLNIYHQLLSFFRKKKDPYDTFDYLMTVSESLKVKSYFFFMAKGTSKYDNFYVSHSAFISALISKIKSRGHYIGIHPSYNSYCAEKLLISEIVELKRNLNVSIKFGRQHFLRFEIPDTWQIWENTNMEWDSTLNYADKEGFRAGVCYQYSVYNILTRRKLKLKERPLIVMDGNLERCSKRLSATDMELRISALIETVKKYDGDFVFLWHNSSFNSLRWKTYNNVYEKVLKR